MVESSASRAKTIVQSERVFPVKLGGQLSPTGFPAITPRCIETVILFRDVTKSEREVFDKARFKRVIPRLFLPVFRNTYYVEKPRKNYPHHWSNSRVWSSDDRTIH